MKQSGKKGTKGYIRKEKGKRFLIMLLMFAIPLGIFFTGYHMYQTRANLLTVVAVVGIIPAARFAVSFIMMFLQKGVSEEIYQLTQEKGAHLLSAYELTVTAYEGYLTLDALVIFDHTIAAFCREGSKEKNAMMQSHIVRLLRAEGIYPCQVNLYSEKKPYEERLCMLDEKAAAAGRGKNGSMKPAREDPSGSGDSSGSAGETEIPIEERILQVLKDISL